MTLTVDDRELIELIESLQKRTEWRDEFSAGTRDLFEEAAARLQSLLSDRDKLTEDYLFAKRQWHQESERAERLENELAPLRKLRDDPSWEVVRAALRSTDNG